MTPEIRYQILSRLRAADPAQRSELEYSSPFELLVAVLLSAQATDVSVNKATAKLFPVANTPQALLALGAEGIKPYIRTIGLFNTKAENIAKLCAMLLARHQGEVPEDRAALEALPGVGRIKCLKLFGEDASSQRRLDLRDAVFCEKALFRISGVQNHVDMGMVGLVME